MITRGRSIYATSKTAGNLTRYLLHNPKNEQAIYLGGNGTAFENDLEKSIQQMIWRAEDSRSQKPLYFTALSPDLAVDKQLTEAEWEFMRHTQARHLGLENQPYQWVEHHKTGRDGQVRVHRHVVYQRYDSQQESMISDEFDKRKNRLACAEIEETLGHERTFKRWTKEEMEKNRQMERATQFFTNLDDVQEIKKPEPKEPTAAQSEVDEFYERMKKQYENKQGWKH